MRFETLHLIRFRASFEGLLEALEFLGSKQDFLSYLKRLNNKFSGCKLYRFFSDHRYQELVMKWDEFVLQPSSYSAGCTKINPFLYLLNDISTSATPSYVISTKRLYRTSILATHILTTNRWCSYCWTREQMLTHKAESTAVRDTPSHRAPDLMGNLAHLISLPPSHLRYFRSVHHL